MERKVLLGIDFNNLLFGSYYGAPLINSKGINVNAIKGFFFKLKSLKEIFNPDYIVFANDLSRRKTFRRQLYPPYKAQRKPHNEDIVTQLRYGAQLSALIGYPFINNELYEADDILGMLSKFSAERDMDMVIASSDRDMYQLVSDTTFIFSPRGKDLITRSYMQEKYQLTPEQWIELKMLQGDRSDNIPGIHGIGESTALQLMQRYHSIDGIYQNLHCMKQSLRNTLEAGRDTLPLTRELVTIVTDYTKIGLTEKMINPNERFEQEVFDLLYYLELHSLFNVMQYTLFVDKERTVEDEIPTS